ncbi:acetoacetate--CoA ligase [Actinomadura sp. 1N219]|uniref:acetoacetate--CoA ligase n=1 Tax=Actinomadura sp. 1N219 TaxID=3375152 RepID=UPI0037B5065B
MADETGVWRPGPQLLRHSRIVEFANWARDEKAAPLSDAADYFALQEWSATHVEDFWDAAAQFFDVRFHTPPRAVLADRAMPGARWFPGATLNFAEHLLAGHPGDRTAIIALDETGGRRNVTYAELRELVASFAAHLDGLGVRPGDRVAGYLPSGVEGVVAFAAAASIGACWAQVGLDYNAPAAADRLAQLEPVVLVAASGYRFKGRAHDRRDQVTELRRRLPSLRHTVTVDPIGAPLRLSGDVTEWEDATAKSAAFAPVPVPFDHPLWVLFTSGTTGLPKGIVHGHGGILLEQLVAEGLHFDLGSGDTFFWYTSPNWMMWNVQVSGLLFGATIVLYDGGPTSPGVDALWRIVAENSVSVFGTSPGYLQASAKAGLEPARDLDLSALRTIGVTGSVLPASGNRWVREHIGADVQVNSVSGGTDIVGAFVGAAPTTAVRDGEISGPALGVALAAWDDDARPVIGEPGEMVITAPLPSMPLELWNDPDGERYRDAYFSTFPGVWRQGDSITVFEHGAVQIHGRSDATLNRNGIRLGTAEIYDAVEALPFVQDSLVTGMEQASGDYWMPMFLVLTPETEWTQETERMVRDAIARHASPRHVPDDFHIVPALPHTRTGKKLEVPVKRILQGADPASVFSPGAVDAPESVEWFVRLAAERRAKSE